MHTNVRFRIYKHISTCLITLVNVYVDLVVFTHNLLPVLHRPEVVDIGVNTILKNMPYA